MVRRVKRKLSYFLDRVPYFLILTGFQAFTLCLPILYFDLKQKGIRLTDDYRLWVFALGAAGMIMFLKIHSFMFLDPSTKIMYEELVHIFKKVKNGKFKKIFKGKPPQGIC